MKNFIIVLSTLLLPAIALSQAADDDYWVYLNTRVEILLKDGNLYRGQVIEVNDADLIIQYAETKKSLAFISIRSILKIDGVDIQDETKQTRANPQFSTFSPTALPIEGFQYRNDWLLLNRFSFPVTSRISMSLSGLRAPKEGAYLWSMIKYSIPISKFIHVAPTGMYTITTEWVHIVNLGASLTVGDASNNLNFCTIFTPYTNRNLSFNFYSSSGKASISKHFSFNIELLTLNPRVEDPASILVITLNGRKGKGELGLGAIVAPSTGSVIPAFSFAYINPGRT